MAALEKRCDICADRITPQSDATHGLTIHSRELGEIRVHVRGQAHCCADCLTTAIAGTPSHGADVIELHRRAGG